MIHIQDTYINENEILAINLHSYGKDDKATYSVMVNYKFNNINIDFLNDKQKALSFMEDLSKKVVFAEDDYIKGFKDGVEYALKLKEIK